MSMQKYDELSTYQQMLIDRLKYILGDDDYELALGYLGNFEDVIELMLDDMEKEIDALNESYWSGDEYSDGVKDGLVKMKKLLDKYRKMIEYPEQKKDKNGH